MPVEKVGAQQRGHAKGWQALLLISRGTKAVWVDTPDSQLWDSRCYVHIVAFLGEGGGQCRFFPPRSASPPVFTFMGNYLNDFSPISSSIFCMFLVYLKRL